MLCGKIRFLPFGRNPNGFNVEAPSLFDKPVSFYIQLLKVRQQADSSCMTQTVAGSAMTKTLPTGEYKKRCLLTIMVSQIL
jgi:hypothetical protein